MTDHEIWAALAVAGMVGYFLGARKAAAKTPVVYDPMGWLTDWAA